MFVMCADMSEPFDFVRRCRSGSNVRTRVDRALVALIDIICMHDIDHEVGCCMHMHPCGIYSATAAVFMATARVHTCTGTCSDKKLLARPSRWWVPRAGLRAHVHKGEFDIHSAARDTRVRSRDVHGCKAYNYAEH